MTHLALYREWRPQTLAEVVGQSHVVRTLRNALLAGTTAHAYLFAGPRGTGKTSVARILARAVNCPEPQEGEPCNRCPLCVEISQGACLDVLEIDAASNRGIDEIRELREKLRYVPARARFKVYIIDEVHMLTPEAFNALLKTLEEPPEHVRFVLATTEPHRVPATILSRCQRFDFHRLSPGDVLRRLQEVRARHGLKVDDGALRLLARHADGSLRDALGMLDQCLSFAAAGVGEGEVLDLLGVPPSLRFAELCRSLADSDPAAVLRTLDELVSAGYDVAQVARDWLAYARSLLLAGLESAERPAVSYLAEYSPEEVSELRSQARRLGRARLLALVEGLIQAEAQMKWSPRPQLLLELLALRLSQPPAEATVAPSRAAPGAAAEPAARQAAGPAAPARPAARVQPGPPAPGAVAAQGPTSAPVQPPPPSPAGTVAGVPASPAGAPAARPQEGGPPREAAAVPRPAPVRSAAGAPPEAEPGGPSAAPDLESVLAVWPQVKQVVYAVSRPLASLLNHAEPVAAGGGTVELEAAEVYRDGIMRGERRRIVEEALGKVLGQKVRLNCRLRKEGGPAGRVAWRGALGQKTPAPGLGILTPPEGAPPAPVASPPQQAGAPVPAPVVEPLAGPPAGAAAPAPGAAVPGTPGQGPRGRARAGRRPAGAGPAGAAGSAGRGGEPGPAPAGGVEGPPGPAPGVGAAEPAPTGSSPVPRRGRRAKEALEADREAALALEIVGGRLVDPGELGVPGPDREGR
ncbi:MAG: DNA polymerase III subunit gamma/tau [Acetobacteraceae bacterium]|nr:DNA polymerase III subunit gamma/tau [Acetobacteraceae bacterium]